MLRYVWDREEQIAPLAALIAGVLEPHAGGRRDPHPLAASPSGSTAKRWPAQLDAVEAELRSRTLGLAAAARLREQLADLADRAAWLADDGRGTWQHLVDRYAGILASANSDRSDPAGCRRR